MLDRGFWVICTISGLLGLAISFTSMWFLHQTSPTTYRWASPLFPGTAPGPLRHLSPFHMGLRSV